MAAMTAITQPLTTPEFSGAGTTLNPATGAVAGEVRWTETSDVPASPPNCVRRNGNGNSVAPRSAPGRWPASRCGSASTAAKSRSC
jgi:hypothetical protein